MADIDKNAPEKSTRETHLPFHETASTVGVEYDSPWKQGSVDPQSAPMPHTQAGKGPRGYVRRDERIYEDVCEVLTCNDEIDASRVEVAVKAGKLLLTGHVATQWAKHEIEKISRLCPGVKEIENKLELLKND